MIYQHEWIHVFTSLSIFQNFEYNDDLVDFLATLLDKLVEDMNSYKAEDEKMNEKLQVNLNTKCDFENFANQKRIVFLQQTDSSDVNNFRNFQDLLLSVFYITLDQETLTARWHTHILKLEVQLVYLIAAHSTLNLPNSDKTLKGIVKIITKTYPKIDFNILLEIGKLIQVQSKQYLPLRLAGLDLPAL